MAVATGNIRFGHGAAQGVPGVAADFDKFEQTSNARHNIGFKVEDADGNVYRYCHFGADTNRGVLVAQDLSESSLGDSDNAIVASASASDTSYGTAGQKYLEITAGDSASQIIADQFAGGKFITTDDTGEGYTYDIVGNTANATSGSAFRLQLKQDIQVALDATTDFIIVGNRFANLEIATDATDNILAGVTCATMDVSVASYGWVQTKGIVGCLQTNTVTAGDRVVLSSATDGTIGASDQPAGESSDTLSVIVGSALIAGDTTGHGAFHINLD